MDTKLQIAIYTGIFTISGILIGTLGGFIQNIYNNKIEKNKFNMEKNFEKQEKIMKNKEETYLEALEVLLNIRKYCDYSDWDYDIAHDKYQHELDNINQKSMNVSVKIRLYATDEIFNIYSMLSKYSQFTFSKKRLFQQSKDQYVIQCNMLAKLMKEDLMINNKKSINTMNKRSNKRKKLIDWPKGLRQWLRLIIAFSGIISGIIFLNDMNKLATAATIIGFLGYLFESLFTNIEERKKLNEENK
ncbi:hypothetical protein FDB30_04305 [Clostridium botulinum]|uniref:Uncharacterized protein n=1 Tax=Clostridium botulinum TaxID=1491 RepID=A0A846JTE6_CLOBO|nr:hypothetical protein [Clostridium botulinum]KAI3346262.1 hypothetical protein CIT18_14570 [Clostridium botulinum]KOM88873.1 hypothetical protein ACP51_06515 [Clostridium botulinum]KOR57710.1 hypothetical protein ADT22_13205 [Clostridium botulinum]NFE13043.1 hypothetical protein [Clostridium botulinum]NFE85667.1 hypothetical protein [Clostridium botulinum]